MISPIKVTEYVKKVNSDTPAVNGTQDIAQGSTLRFHIPYVGGNALLNPKSIVIRGEFVIDSGEVIFEREGIHGIFKAMRVKHGDRVIEEIERYSDYASWYSQLHFSGANGTSLHCPGDFTDLGNYESAGAAILWPQSGISAIGPLDVIDDVTGTGHEFAFTPLSAVLGSRSTKEKFPLCVLNPMEPLVLEFDLDLDGTLINWSSGSGGKFHLKNCYLNADYDMVGESLGGQLRSSMSGITWEIPAYEKHEHPKFQPAGAQLTGDKFTYGGIMFPDIEDTFLIRSNVQAMTRMIHYFKHKGYEDDTTEYLKERGFLQYPELTRWQYLIDNQHVPDRPITATIYQTGTSTGGGAFWPRAHFGRMYTTSMKTMGNIGLEPTCGFHPMVEFVFDYSKRLPGAVTGAFSVASMTAPFEYDISDTPRGDDGGFFLAYDFTRSPERSSSTAPWGVGSFRLKDTEFQVTLGMNNRLGIRAGQAPSDYTLVVVTLVEYKRKLVLDKLGRLEAFF